MDSDELQRRRRYVDDEIEASGLAGEAAELARAGAMSAADDDIYCADDFELLVAACIEGADESTR